MMDQMSQEKKKTSHFDGAVSRCGVATSSTQQPMENNKKVQLDMEDRLAIGHMKYAQGMGAALKYATELKAVQQINRLPFLPSSHLQEDVLRGKLGPGTGFENMFGDAQFEEEGPRRVMFL